MGRKPLVIKEFTKGVHQTNPYVDIIKFLRIQGFKFGDRIGSLVSRGGWADWDTPTDFTRILGIKEWYRGDGSRNLLFFGIESGNDPKVYYYNQHNKTVSSIFTYTDAVIEDTIPIQFIDCGNQLILLPGTVLGRPISVKLYETPSTEGGLAPKLLGLDPPKTIATFVTGSIAAGLNQQTADGLDNGVYQYTYTYCYGPRRANELYGESAPAPAITINRTDLGVGSRNGINQIQPTEAVFGTAVQKIKIYRTLKGGSTFYEVGEITEEGFAGYFKYFNDTMYDGLVDTSKVLPTQTGIPKGMRCGLWHKSLSRLYWFGEDGFFHWSAAGYPDINPLSWKMAVGDTGYKGNAVVTIRNNIFCLKEDGIYIVSGNAPNYFSELIDPIPCLGKNTVVQMPDGIYFLGADGDQLKVFRFDGNQAVSVSDEKINAILGRKKTYKLNLAYAVQKNEEYCLFTITSDRRVYGWHLPYNNIALYYDYRNSEWTTDLVQAACGTIFDGPGDSGEFWVAESDPTASASKGTFFRYEHTLNIRAGTTYTNGTRFYTKTTLINRSITFEVMSTILENSDLSKINISDVLLRYKWNPSFAPTISIFDNAEEIGGAISGMLNLLPDANGSFDKYKEMTITGDSSCLLNTGKLGSMKPEKNIFEEVHYPISDIYPRTGYAVDIRFITSKTDIVNLDAIQLMLDDTNPD